MINEVWKEVKGYEGLYLASNLGNIKSVSRIFIKSNGTVFTVKEKIMTMTLNKSGYYYCSLTKDKKTKSLRSHRVIASSFLGESNLTVNHINHIKTDNRIENLEWVTNAENNRKRTFKKSKTSMYLGVAYKKGCGVWISYITEKGVKTNIGRFKTEEDAHNAYLNKIKELNQLK